MEHAGTHGDVAKTGKAAVTKQNLSLESIGGRSVTFRFDPDGELVTIVDGDDFILSVEDAQRLREWLAHEPKARPPDEYIVWECGRCHDWTMVSGSSCSGCGLPRSAENRQVEPGADDRGGMACAGCFHQWPIGDDGWHTVPEGKGARFQCIAQDRQAEPKAECLL